MEHGAWSGEQRAEGKGRRAEEMPEIINV